MLNCTSLDVEIDDVPRIHSEVQNFQNENFIIANGNETLTVQFRFHKFSMSSVDTKNIVDSPLKATHFSIARKIRRVLGLYKSTRP